MFIQNCGFLLNIYFNPKLLCFAKKFYVYPNFFYKKIYVIFIQNFFFGEISMYFLRFRFVAKISIFMQQV